MSGQGDTACRTLTILTKYILNAPISISGYPVLKYASGSLRLTNHGLFLKMNQNGEIYAMRNEGQRDGALEVKDHFCGDLCYWFL